jgi:hypothetical protein
MLSHNHAKMSLGNILFIQGKYRILQLDTSSPRLVTHNLRAIYTFSSLKPGFAEFTQDRRSYYPMFPYGCSLTIKLNRTI